MRAQYKDRLEKSTNGVGMITPLQESYRVGGGGEGGSPHESRELIPPKGGVTGTKVVENFTSVRNPVTPQGGSATRKPKVWDI